ncbi:MAG: hypothetical protein GF335_03380 [Candidatus Moranbacteria bacterium]|nr:hypothetical protein [Candidatus Moranbacteria bacterium]
MYILFFFLICFIFGFWILASLDKEDYIKGLLRIILTLAVGFAFYNFLLLILALGFRDLNFSLHFLNIFLFLLSFFVFLASQSLSKKIKLYKISSRSFKKINIFTVIFGLIVFAFVLNSLQGMLWKDSVFPYGILKGWGDGAYHMGMIKHLSVSDPFKLDHPVAGGHPLTYTFFINFTSAVLLKAGLSFKISWHLPLLIFGLSFVFLLKAFGKLIFKKESLAVALLFLTLFGSGGGFVYYFGQAGEKYNESLPIALIKEFKDPSYEYSHLDQRTGGKPAHMNHNANIVWIVPLISFFSHQRSFNAGAFLFFLILYGVFLYRFKKKVYWQWFFPGIIFPFSHVHSFLAFAILIFALIIQWIKKDYRIFISKSFIFFVFLILLFIIPQILFILKGTEISQKGIVKPWFGWMQCTHKLNWFSCDEVEKGMDKSFWFFTLKNFGAVFLVWVFSIALFFKIKNKKIKQLIIPSILIFLIFNFFKFQPWEFDNNKIIFYWWILAVILGLNFFNLDFFCQKCSERVKNKIKIVKKTFLILFIILASLAGLIDSINRLKNGLEINNTKNYGYFAQEDLKTYHWIEKNTLPNDIILTCSNANNKIAILTGRAVYLGFSGWLWTQGNSELIQDRSKNIRNFLNNSDSRKICRDQVTHVLIDECFERDFNFSLSKLKSGPSIVEKLNPKYPLYKIKCPK